jgi:CopG family nickel-responsive transcriptional regulator
MERVTVSIDADLIAAFDAFIARKGYSTRSEAVRDIVRDRLKAEELREGVAADCVACLSYVFNHNERELSRRLTEALHSHHDLARSTMHIHLDHDDCLEATILEGPTTLVTAVAEALISQKGVRHGQVNLVPVETTTAGAERHNGGNKASHFHRSPKT